MAASSATTPRRQAGKGVERRAAIIETAKGRLIERGIEGLVLRDVASELGITHGNLQYYFPTKNELIKAIFDELVGRFTTAMHESIASSNTPTDMISEIVDSNLRVLAHPETRLWRILFGMADQAPDLAAILKQENQFFESVLVSELKVVAPDTSDERLAAIAKTMRLLIDGIAIELIYSDLATPAMQAMVEDFKRTVAQLLSIER